MAPRLMAELGLREADKALADFDHLALHAPCNGTRNMPRR
jgi:hypothetical protein